MPEMVAAVMIVFGFFSYAFTDQITNSKGFKKHGLDDEAMEKMKKNYRIRSLFLIIIGVIGLLLILIMKSR